MRVIGKEMRSGEQKSVIKKENVLRFDQKLFWLIITETLSVENGLFH
jgi:hypothetical protein